MKTYHSKGNDVHLAMRILGFHNSHTVRAFRAKNGDVDLFCLCDMCTHSRKVLEDCNI